MSFDAKADARATTIDPADVIPFGDVSVDGWETITVSNLIDNRRLLTGPSAAPDVGSISWLRRFKAQDLADAGGADASAVSSWTDKGGSGDPAVQATGGNQPILKTAANGINSLAVVRFDGSNDYLRTVLGGTSLVSAFYYGWLGRFRGGLGSFQSVIAAGEESTGKRREFYKYNSDPTDTMGFSGYFADVVSRGTAETANAVAFHECWYDGAYIWIARDGVVECVGVPAANSLVSFTATTITLGANQAGSEAFNGDLAEVFILGSVPTAIQRQAVLDYIYATYGVAQASRVPVTRVNGTTVSLTGAFDDGGAVHFLYPVRVGGGAVAYVGSATGNGATVPAIMSVMGPFVADSTGSTADHMFIGDNANNVLCVMNRKSNGFSAFTARDRNRYERFAIGFSNGTTFPFGGPNGSVYVEFSNFADATKYGDWREVQTKSGGLTKLRRRVRDDTNAIEQYDLTAAEPSVSGTTTGLVSLTGKPVTAVADNGTLNTNITTGATQCGLVVVKDATNSKCALYRLENTTLTAIGTLDASFTTTLDNAGTINTYNSSGQLVVQNKTGGSLNLTAAYYGA